MLASRGAGQRRLEQALCVRPSASAGGAGCRRSARPRWRRWCSAAWSTTQPRGRPRARSSRCSGGLLGTLDPSPLPITKLKGLQGMDDAARVLPEQKTFKTACKRPACNCSGAPDWLYVVCLLQRRCRAMRAMRSLPPHKSCSSVTADCVSLHCSTLQNDPAPPGAGYLPAMEDPDRRQSVGFRSREPPEALQS